MATSDIQVETLRQEYLKLGCGVTAGVDPSIIPLSLTVRTPPGSNRAFRRSSTDGLQREPKRSTGPGAILTTALARASCSS